jgi:pimeloyl-ACP methyl ester carboxylesterase
MVTPSRPSKAQSSIFGLQGNRWRRRVSHLARGFSVLALVGLAAVLSGNLAYAQTDQTVDVPTRPGQNVRMLLLTPSGKAEGSVILLAGGHGNLQLGKDGSIGWGKGNQLVRTRAAYAKAGFVTAVPDMATDAKQGAGVVQRFRWSEAHARDIGALVKHMHTLAAPVYLVGTSRAALSVANAAVRLAGAERPDAIVITSGLLMNVDNYQPSAERNVGRLERITQPTFIVFHTQDGCKYSKPSSAGRFKPLLSKAAKVDVKLLSGGTNTGSEPCEADTHHGFQGQDAEVVQLVTSWLKALPKP